MNTISAIKLNATTTSLHVQRAALAPTNRDLSLLLQSKFGREPDTFKARELQLARVVFAQVALMAGAALVADTETFVGAEQLWRDMQESIGPQERALARHFLELLSRDEYYSPCERKIIAALAALVAPEESRAANAVHLDWQPDWMERVCGHEAPQKQHAVASVSAWSDDTAPRVGCEEAAPVMSLDSVTCSVEPQNEACSVACSVEPQDQGYSTRLDDAACSIWLDDASTPLRVQRAALAPSNRELAPLLEAQYGRSLDSFEANELAIARVVFAQVALMAGAALAADTETYVGAEALWRDMLNAIGPRERAMAKRFLELLSRDEYYLESDRRLIAALAAGLTENGKQPRRGPSAAGAQIDRAASLSVN